MHWWAQGCGSRSHSFMSGLSTKKDRHQEKKRGAEQQERRREGDKCRKIMQRKQMMRMMKGKKQSGAGHEDRGGR